MKRIFNRSCSSSVSRPSMDSSFDENNESCFRQMSLEETGSSSPDLPRRTVREGRGILKQSWGEKESGQKIFGQYNWRKRWFELTQKEQILLFSYYVKSMDKTPKGEILLTQEYTARELEMNEKSKPSCFALGPILDSSALRTYYVSCNSEEEKVDWITSLNCAIEGVPEKILKRKTTYNIKHSKREQGRRITYPPPELNSKGDTFSYLKFAWRFKQWKYLCQLSGETNWKRKETKQGITISRQSFKDTEIAVIKIESILPVPRQMVYEFLQRSVRPGGKFDFILRGESLLQQVEEYCSLTEVVLNSYDVPLPGMKRRDICCARMWFPDFITDDSSSGVLVMSVNHPKAQCAKDMERIFVDISGMVLYDEPEKDGEQYTKITVLLQIDLQNALQNMLRGAYKSGLLKKGIRNGFGHFSKCLLAYKDMLSI